MDPSPALVPSASRPSTKTRPPERTGFGTNSAGRLSTLMRRVFRLRLETGHDVEKFFIDPGSSE